MANKDMAVAPGEALVGPPGSDAKITSKSEMPPAEPGHDVAKAKEGQVFDPNAARRYADGEIPWLQDSEAVSPAHWPSEASQDPFKVEVTLLEREIEQKKKQLAELKKAEKERNG